MDTGRGPTAQHAEANTEVQVHVGQGEQQGSWRAHGSTRGTMKGALCGGTQKDTCICTSPPQGDGSRGGTSKGVEGTTPRL